MKQKQFQKFSDRITREKFKCEKMAQNFEIEIQLIHRFFCFLYLI